MENKINIAMCMDDGYVKPSLVCIKSILENNTTPINIYIIYSNLSDKKLEMMKKFVKNYGDQYSLLGVKVDGNYFNAGPIHGRAREAYFRLLIPYLLPKEIEKCIYLDGDTVVNHKLDSFFETSFNDKALIACEDVGEILFFHKERHPILGIPKEYRYFNSGVLIFNNVYFRNNIKLEDIEKYIINNADKLKFLDQDVLNGMFYDQVKLVESNLYDYMEILVSHMLDNDNMDKAVIVHFLKKPWHYNYNGINAKYWWKYAKSMYKLDYFKFSFFNFLFRKSLAVLLLFLSIQKIKKISLYFKS